MQLAQWQERFAELGVEVAAMSYDAREIQAGFHRQHDLGYPLLQDRDAHHMKAYGVLNPEYQPGDSAYGIPLPGVLFIAPDGTILAKFAEPGYKARPQPQDMLLQVSQIVRRRAEVVSRTADDG